MAVTANKGYELIVTGTEVDTWGAKLNSDVFGRVDDNLGGVVTKSLTNVQVDLNAAESRMLRLVLNGTLTDNVLVTTQAVGMTIIENQCTGNFTVSFQKNGVGTPISIPNGTNNLVTTGASGNPAAVGIDFPAGTRIPFQQTTPPPGYSKDTTTVGLNNSAMRIVTGTVGSGGSQDFTTAFASRSLGGSVQNTTLDATQIPSHRHLVANTDNVVQGTGLNSGSQVAANASVTSGNNDQYILGGTATDATVGRTSAVGGGQPHTHGLTLSNLDMAVRYFDFCIGVKV